MFRRCWLRRFYWCMHVSRFLKARTGVLTSLRNPSLPRPLCSYRSLSSAHYIDASAHTRHGQVATRFVVGVHINRELYIVRLHIYDGVTRRRPRHEGGTWDEFSRRTTYFAEASRRLLWSIWKCLFNWYYNNNILIDIYCFIQIIVIVHQILLKLQPSTGNPVLNSKSTTFRKKNEKQTRILKTFNFGKYV